MARRPRRPLGPLDLRTQAILRAVIEEYVTTATPVGSQALVERYRLGVSSATVRSILAELEANGLLTHPHTSAGRIPTDAGYRFYVESIVDAVPLPAVEQLMIRHQFGQVEFASEHWFRLAATTLASVTRSAGLATPAKPRDAHIRRIDLVAINERMASLILVLREGAIKQALITVDGDDAIDQPTLNAVAALLNERLVDMTASRAEARIAALDGDDRVDALARRVGERVVKVVREYDAEAIEEVFSDGLLNVMEAPEFAQSDKLRRVFNALENRAYLGQLVGSVAGSGSVQVFIGHENQPARDARRLARPRTVWPARPGDRRRRRPGADPDVLLPGHRHGPFRVRPHERTGGSPLCLTDHARAREERADEIDISPTALLARSRPSRRERDDAIRTTDEYLSALQRERAEFQNFKRRTSEERMRDLGLAGEDLIRKVLAVADDFDRAIEARPASVADDPWFEGIAAIDRKLRLLLDSEGVTTIDASPGRPFDPREHEAIANVPGTDQPEGDDRRGDPARLSAPRPRHPPGPRGRRHQQRYRHDRRQHIRYPRSLNPTT